MVVWSSKLFKELQIMAQWLSSKLDVKTSDVDEQRRAKLLNILLLGMLILAFLALIGTIAIFASGQSVGIDNSTTIISTTVMIAVVGLIFGINRYFSPTGASILFLIFLTLIVWLPTEPYETVWGRNMIMMVLPIIMASVILPPISSFITAALIAILLVFTANQNDFSVNYVGILANFMIALVSWLSASTLEKTLDKIREINKDLDAKVEERTKELVIANEQLSEARDAAVEASQYKTELTARVSHELRTPLGGILGFAEMLFEGYFGPVNEKQQAKLTAIMQTTKNLSTLVGDWLDQAKLESGKLELYNYWFAVREAMKYVEDLTQVLIKDKPIQLFFNVDTAVPNLLYGDEDRILQLMINLVTNAIKYTDQGAVHTSVYLVEQTHWIIAVKDTGIGIPEKSLPTIFTSFSQVDGSRTRKQTGFGLGLSIVQQLVDLMEGEIKVESEVGVGSTFQIILPIITDDKNPNKLPATEEETL